MKKKLILSMVVAAIAIAMLIKISGQPRLITGVVIKVVDGDTFDILTDDDKIIRIRMSGVDTPELDGATRKFPGLPKHVAKRYAMAAKDSTTSWLLRKPAIIRSEGTGYYGRTLGHVYTVHGENVNKKLLKAGLARHTAEYRSGLDKIYKETEADAKKKGVGLWKHVRFGD